MPYGLSSDIWALGCVFFAMLTGRPPFEGASIAQTFVKTKNLEFTYPEYISENAKSLISSMLNIDPGERITPSQILSHDFFLNSTTEESYYEYSEAPLTCRNANDSHIKSMQFSLLSPIQTHGLPPFLHEIKNGKIEITAFGWVKVEIANKTLEISQDGGEVFYRGIKYSLSNLPSHAEKLYRYAEQCINTIKSKTPRIVVKDKGAIFTLMSNFPQPNFEAEFGEVKILYQLGDEILMVREKNNEFYVGVNEQGQWEDLIQNTLKGLRSCIKKANIHNEVSNI